MLREQEAGATTADVCRRHGISEQTFYRWKAKYGGMAPSDAVRLKSLETGLIGLTAITRSNIEAA